MKNMRDWNSLSFQCVVVLCYSYVVTISKIKFRHLFKNANDASVSTCARRGNIYFAFHIGDVSRKLNKFASRAPAISRLIL